MTGIYCITNKINGKSYVGQSINIEERWKAHKTRPFNENSSQYNKPLYRAIRKYGLENFIFSILEECKKEDLDKAEIFWINRLDTYNNGYNLTAGGQNARTSSVLEESEVVEIKKLLLESNLTETQISELFEISQRTISSINLGQTWFDENLSYPLLKNRCKTHKYFCIDCGAPITNKGIRCIECAKIASRTVERPNREELKQLIRTKSFSALGRQFNVSDTAIKKWCIAEKLPHKKTLINKYSDEEWLKI